ncbi:hypothetical protein DFH06DRAFT_1429458 [Mycena polygramma]|nr:hypothetical protein DFH06DRAFT_1429458 [Mycena polygramma]
MPSKPLEEPLATAEALRTRCQTEPDMNVYQPIATSAVEVCVAATPGSRSKTSWLAVQAVKKTSALIEQGANLPMTPERQLGLERFERALDNVRRHIESIPERGSGKSSKFRFSALKFDRESWHLKGDLKATYNISTRVADAICEIPFPGLALGKPAVAMVALICETAKTVIKFLGAIACAWQTELGLDPIYLHMGPQPPRLRSIHCARRSTGQKYPLHYSAPPADNLARPRPSFARLELARGRITGEVNSPPPNSLGMKADGIKKTTTTYSSRLLTLSLALARASLGSSSRGEERPGNSNPVESHCLFIRDYNSLIRLNLNWKLKSGGYLISTEFWCKTLIKITIGLRNVTESIVARADTAMHGESLAELCRALQQVQDFLTTLQNRRRVASWIFAIKDKERFAELNCALDRALQVFSASENIGATEIAHGNTQVLTTLVATVHRVEDDVKRTMSLSPADFILYGGDVVD